MRSHWHTESPLCQARQWSIRSSPVGYSTAEQWRDPGWVSSGAKVSVKVCNFQNSTEIVYRDEAAQDVFITGLLSNTIHQRLLENNTLDLSTMFTQARSLDAVQRSSESYLIEPSVPNYHHRLVPPPTSDLLWRCHRQSSCSSVSS